MGGVDEAPASVEIGVLQQPFDRPSTGPGQAVVHLAHLLGDVNMDRPVAGERHERGQLLRRDGAQAVRRHPEIGVVELGGERAGALEHAGEQIEVGNETPLLRLRRRACEAGMGVQYREQRQPNAGRVAGGANPRGHLGRIGIGRSVQVMVQVVELADAGEARLQHLDIGLRGDRFGVVGRHRKGETVHRFPPAPEAVDAGAAGLGEAGHATLKRVRMEVRHAGQGDGMPLVARARCAVGDDRGDPAGRQLDPHILQPAATHQRFVEMQSRHWLSPPLASSNELYIHPYTRSSFGSLPCLDSCSSMPGLRRWPAVSRLLTDR